MRFFITLISILILLTSKAFPISLKEKMDRAQPGDYIVLQQDKNFAVLFLRSIEQNSVQLEEISTAQNPRAQNMTWKEWVHNGAPGASGWLIYEIDTQNFRVAECYAPSQRQWVFIDASAQFLPQLLGLNLRKIPLHERRKIGPGPKDGESDNRKIWNPKIFCEGALSKSNSASAFHSEWPKDGSRLAGCTVELYFDDARPSFPFPIWFEVSNGHYTFKMQAADSGSGMISAFKEPMPHRPPLFRSAHKVHKESISLPLELPRTEDTLHLYAVPTRGDSTAPIPIPFTLTSGSSLEITLKDLKHLLSYDMRYRWILTVEEYPDIYVESSFNFSLQNLK